MKIIVSYSEHDSDFAEKLANCFIINGVEASLVSVIFKPEENLLETIKCKLSSSDAMIVILSKNFLCSVSSWEKMNTFTLLDFIIKDKPMIAVLIEDCQIPAFLQDKALVDFRDSSSHSFETFIYALKKEETEESKNIALSNVTDNRAFTTKFYIEDIKKNYRDGDVCLFVGEELSVASGLPKKQTAIDAVFMNTCEGIFNDHISDMILKDTEYSATLKLFLKTGLGKEFLSMIQSELYKKEPSANSTIDSIALLCARKKISALIAYGIDDLIENKLFNYGICYTPIYKEGQTVRKNTLPIYYINGYVPRVESRRLRKGRPVLTENDQPADQSHWTSRVQISHLCQDLCIFIGVELTDKYLKMLLSAAKAFKNPLSKPNHYIFKRRYRKDEKKHPCFIKTAELLDEIYAIYLGLHIIWINQEDEIQEFLKQIM